MDLSVIVLAAGRGARMRSEQPKVLHPVAGRPMVRYVLDAARSLGPACLVAVVGHREELVRKELGDGVRVAAQSEQRGTAHAVLQAEPAAAGQASTVLVLYGDTPLILPETLGALVDHHQGSGAVVTLVSLMPGCPAGYGRVVREPISGRVRRVVEEPDLGAELRGLGEAAGGAFCFRDTWLWPALAQLERGGEGERHLTRLVEMAAQQGLTVLDCPVDELEAAGVNDRVGLARAEAEMRRRINERWMASGVTLVDPAATYIDAGVEIGCDTTIWPGTSLQGATRVGSGCAIGPGAVVRDSSIGDRCTVELSVVEGAVMDEGSNVGPFSHLRKGSHLGPGAHVGNFGELKNSYLGPSAKMGHFSYLGDATVGENANIGAGTVTCNFDGQRKHATVVGKDAFVGSDTLLVAPVTVGDGAKTGAGSVVTHDVPPGTVVYGVPARVRSEPVEEQPEQK